MDLTPWELARRIDGYKARIDAKRFFYAAYVTVPVINSGHPKHAVSIKKVVPDLYKHHAELSEEGKESLMKLMEEQERRRKDGKS